MIVIIAINKIANCIFIAIYNKSGIHWLRNSMLAKLRQNTADWPDDSRPGWRDNRSPDGISLLREPWISSHPGEGRGPACWYPWMIRFAHPAGRPPGVQRATRFCPACAGMTKDELIRPSLVRIFIIKSIVACVVKKFWLLKHLQSLD